MSEALYTAVSVTFNLLKKSNIACNGAGRKWAAHNIKTDEVKLIGYLKRSSMVIHQASHLIAYSAIAMRPLIKCDMLKTFELHSVLCLFGIFTTSTDAFLGKLVFTHVWWENTLPRMYCQNKWNFLKHHEFCLQLTTYPLKRFEYILLLYDQTNRTSKCCLLIQVITTFW